MCAWRTSGARAARPWPPAPVSAGIPDARRGIAQPRRTRRPGGGSRPGNALRYCPTGRSFNDHIRAQPHRLRYRQANLACRLEVDGQPNPAHRLDRQARRAGSSENPPDVFRGQATHFIVTCAIANLSSWKGNNLLLAHDVFPPTTICRGSVFPCRVPIGWRGLLFQV